MHSGFFQLLLCASVLALVSCASASDFRVVSTRRNAPAGWTLGARADSSASINFFLALKQQNLDVLEAKFWSVSDPKSAEYRQFLSLDQINAIIAPKQEHFGAVIDWLGSKGVKQSEIGQYADALEVTVSVAVAESLLQTQFYQFHHGEWDRTVIRQFGDFSLPKHLFDIVELVLGVQTFPNFRPDRSHRKAHHSASDAAATQFGVVAQTIYNLYSIPAQVSQNASSITSQGVIEFEYQTYSPDDLQEYGKLVSIPIPALTDAHIIGGPMYNGGEEANLDIQFISTVNTEAMNWFWLVDDTAWLYTFTTQFLNTTDVPQVISISYGWWEGGQCSIDEDECKELKVKDDAYVARLNVDFQRIALRGVSILVSSGDSGAHTRSDPDCKAKTLRTEFPATSPYVTSVGATQLTNETPLSGAPKICSELKDYPQCAASGTEVAVSFDVAGFTSGGGFSEVAAQPSFQSAAVQAYLSSGVTLPPSSMYNASNRAVPDVAAVGNANLIFDSYYDGVEAIGGTSASTPIFAAVVSLLNQASIAKSGKPLGFVSPLLYQIAADRPEAFHDITVGSNACTENGCAKSCTGWQATKNWDPVTGLGTPNFLVLLEEVQKLTGGKANDNSGSATM